MLAPELHCQTIVFHHPPDTRYDVSDLKRLRQPQRRKDASGSPADLECAVSEITHQPPGPRGRSLLIANTDILLPHSIGQISSRGTRLRDAAVLETKPYRQAN